MAESVDNSAADCAPESSQVSELSDDRRANTRAERVSLAAGGLAENAFQNALLTLANPIFNIGMQVSPVVVGIAMAIPRFWELILDPWIGAMSDRTQSRWGRRVPWIVISSIFCVLAFAAVWLVPASWSVNAKGIWLIAGAFVFYTAYSFFAVPYAALTIDETREGADRTRVMTSRVAFANFSALMLNWLYWMCQSDIFSSPLEGIRWVGPAFGLVVGLTILLPVWTALRKNRARRVVQARADQAVISKDLAPSNVTSSAIDSGKKKGSYRWILKIPAMRCVVVAMLSILLGFTLVGHLGFYLIAYHACEGDLKKAGLITGIAASAAAIVGIGCCPIISGIATRIGKRTTLLSVLLVGILASLSQWWLLTPVNPYLSIIPAVGNTIGLAGFLSLMPAFLGDVSDNFQARTGLRCQGMFVAVYGVAVKVGASMALMATGYVLVVCGFRADMELGQMGEAMVRMRLFYALIPALAGVGAIIAMSFFRLPTVATMTSEQ